jgi:hypothetical protein
MLPALLAWLLALALPPAGAHPTAERPRRWRRRRPQPPRRGVETATQLSVANIYAQT